MPTVNAAVHPNGPQITVILGPPVAPAAPGAAPANAPLNTIIDTAASRTAVSDAVLKALHIPAIRQENVTRAGYAGRQANIHRVSFWSQAGDLIVADIEVCDIHPVGASVLLGQDVLVRGVLEQDGPAGTAHFTFP